MVARMSSTTAMTLGQRDQPDPGRPRDGGQPVGLRGLPEVGLPAGPRAQDVDRLGSGAGQVHAGQSAARIGLGRIALDAGDAAEALRQLRAADELGRRSGQSLVRALAAEPLARALLVSGDAPAARALLEEPLAGCRRMEARPLLARLESALAEIPA